MLSVIRAIRLAGLQGLCVVAFILLARVVSAECETPQYEIGRVVEDTQATLRANVGVKLSDLAPGRAICLAEVLRHRYQDRRTVEVLIFDTTNAARAYMGDLQVGDTGSPMSPKDARIAASIGPDHLRAIYRRNADTSDESITIKPLGFYASNSEDTTFQLPTSSQPHCRLEVKARCLLKLAEVGPEPNAYTSRTAGSVTLRAVITRDGQVGSIRVVAGPSVQAQSMTQAAKRNLASWRFEPSAHNDAIQIKYNYVVDSSLRNGDWKVQFGLPDSVTILYNGRR